MRIEIKLAVMITVMAGLCAEPLGAASYRSVAKTLSRAASRAGVSRVSVAPISPMDGSTAGEGRHITEKLTTYISLRREVAVVERTRLGSVMREHYLGETGAFDPETLVPLGRLRQADAVVAGTFVAIGNTVEINVRLVALETGVVLAARTARIRRDYFTDSRGILPAPVPLGADAAVADVYEAQTGRRYAPPRGPLAYRRPARPAGIPGLRDAPASDSCVGAAERIDSLQADILDLKARYWALKVRRRGFAAASVKYKPGAVISDPALRLEFYERMKNAVERKAPALTMTETRRFIRADRRAFELYQRCRPYLSGNLQARRPL